GQLELTSAQGKTLTLPINLETFRPEVSESSDISENLGVRLDFGVQDAQGHWLVKGARLGFQRIAAAQVRAENNPLKQLLQSGAPLTDEAWFRSLLNAIAESVLQRNVVDLFI